jgi:hypothetical protein
MEMTKERELRQLLLLPRRLLQGISFTCRIRFEKPGMDPLIPYIAHTQRQGNARHGL